MATTHPTHTHTHTHPAAEIASYISIKKLFIDKQTKTIAKKFSDTTVLYQK